MRDGHPDGKQTPEASQSPVEIVSLNKKATNLGHEKKVKYLFNM